jgi:predicted ATP-grasp superfamily ATP-dependent carboligase
MNESTVLVLPVDSSVGLTVARALGRQGVRVVGVSFTKGAYGLKSRYISRGYVIDCRKEERASRLLDILQIERPAFLMAHGEDNLRALNTVRAEAEKYTRLLFPPQVVLDRAFDKSQTLAIAKSLNIPVPQAYVVECQADVVQLAKTGTFPLILKPPRRYDGLQYEHLNFGYKHIFDGVQLTEFLRPYSAAPFYPLIQRYYEGHGLGIETCIYRGEPLAVFQHRRIREYPVNGGPSVYRRSERPDDELERWSLQLLQAMQWDGVAMVEYRYDPVSRSAVLMEVNGRFWGSLPLAVHSGVNFPYLLYQAHGLDRPVRVSEYVEGRYCRQLSADTKWLAAVLLHMSSLPKRLSRSRALAQYIYSFVQCRHFDVEWPDDIKPAIAFWLERLGLRRWG